MEICHCNGHLNTILLRSTNISGFYGFFPWVYVFLLELARPGDRGAGKALALETWKSGPGGREGSGSGNLEIGTGGTGGREGSGSFRNQAT